MPPASFTFLDTFDSGSLGGTVAQLETGTEFSYNTRSATVSPDQFYSGTHSLRFRYGPNAPTADGGDIVQKYWIGQDLVEFWMEWWMKVPATFVHRDNTATADNNKLWTMWRDVYGAAGTTLQFTGEFWRTTNTESRYRPMCTRSTISFVGTAECVFPLATGDRFIHADGPVVPGQWHRLRWHCRPSSAPGVLDHAYTMWIDDAVFHTSPTAHDIFNRSTRSDNTAIVRRGYLMGYSNSGYTDQTDFYIDNFFLTNSNPGW